LLLDFAEETKEKAEFGSLLFCFFLFFSLAFCFLY